MLIGLTYDLRQEYLDEGFGEEETAEFDRAETIDALEAVLRDLGHEIDRIGRVTALVDRLARGDRWDLVYNIAEGMHGIGREAQVPALLDSYRIPYTYSDPLVNALSLHKGMTKRIVRDLGLATPAFAIVQRPSEIADVARTFGPSPEKPLFAKPNAEGTSKGIAATSRITSARQLDDVCQRLLKTFRQPVLVEEFLPGREFTVGIVGSGGAAEVVAVMEVHLLANADADVYTYANKEYCEERVKYTILERHEPLFKEAEALSLGVWRGFECRDGGRVDVRADARGALSFIEINPLPGMHPQHSDLPILASLAGWTYRQLVERIVHSATSRVGTSASLAGSRSS